MLIKSYTSYLLNILSVSWLSIAGLMSIACLIVAVGFFLSKGNQNRFRQFVAPTMLALSFVFLFVSIYTSVYTIDQPNTYVEIAKQNPDDADCGAKWTGWYPIGAGLENPCGKGCYRGATLAQEMKMIHFPPWPVNRREIKCWVREQEPDIASVLFPDEARRY